jgi:carbon-monoxide dehydrogenase large subunit
MARVTTIPPSTFGIPALRTEDPRFLRGEGRYLDNVDIPGALRAVFVRSIFAHATVNAIEGLDEARGAPGVAAVFTADDLDLPAQLAAGSVEVPGGELDRPFERPVLARDRVRYVGEPYAVVAADTLAHALDAAEAIWLDADTLPVVIDPEAAATDDAPLLFPETGTNVAVRFEHGWDADVTAGADVVVRQRMVNQRLAPAPMEMNGIAVVPEHDGGYTVWVSSQAPFDVRNEIAEVLGVDRRAVRAVAPDVGGGFGAKIPIYPEYVVVAKAAEALGAPVRWFEARTESMQSLTHGRAQVQWIELGSTRDGRLVGARFEMLGDVGAYPQLGSFMGQTTAEMISGVYAIPSIAFRGRAVVTNVTPLGAYRGAGRPEAAACIERAMDLLAGELRMDPVELRRRNFIAPDAFPFVTAAGSTYDNGDYARALDRALEVAGYEALRAEQAERRARSDRSALGIGVSTYVEITAFPSKEFAEVSMGADGIATVRVGTTSFGQGHETAFAQLVGGMFAIPYTDVRVIHSDTAEVERGEGSWGSRSLQAGGSVIATRADAVVERARQVAATALEVDVADVVGPSDGRFHVSGAPEGGVG